jgi:hypothetical protein
MALVEEMRTLVDDLETAFSRRLENEHERQENAAGDARDRAAFEHERQAAAAGDAQERSAFEHERQAAAAQDAHERITEVQQLGGIWDAHRATFGSRP